MKLQSDILGDESEGLKIAEEIRQTLVAGKGTLKPIVLVGAGVSSRLGFPTWGQLMDQLHEYASEERRKRDSGPSTHTQMLPKRLLTKQDYLWRAQYYCNELGGDRFEQYVAGVFSQPPRPKEPGTVVGVDACVESIIRLKVSHVLTTNYDTCLDGSHALLRQSSKRDFGRFEVINVDDPDSTRFFIQTLLSPDGNRYYVHLHGRVDQRDSIILTEASYRKRYLSNVSWARTLYSIFSTRQLLCIGFSATDPDLTAVLREISAMGAGVRHYAIIGIEDTVGAKLERQRLEQKYGITPLLYRLKQGEDRHENLRAVLEWLTKEEEVPLRLERTSRKRINKDSTSIPALKSGKERSVNNKHIPDDPRKGCFGGRSVRDGLRLDATIEPVANDPDWFELKLSVKGVASIRIAADSQVQFYVHPTFPRAMYSVRPSDGSARLSLLATGAFTVGVIARKEKSKKPTALELDLAQLERAPKIFRSR